MFKKVYSIITENDFYKFRARCSREGYSMGEGLTAIIHNYANTRDLKLPNKIGKAPKIEQEKEEKAEEKKDGTNKK